MSYRNLAMLLCGRHWLAVLLFLVIYQPVYAIKPLALIQVSPGATPGSYIIDAGNSRDIDRNSVIEQYYFEVTGTGYSYTSLTRQSAITLTFPRPGNYMAVVTVTDSDGEQATSGRMPFVVREAIDLQPDADFSATPRTGDESLTVDFSYTGEKGDEPATVSWSFPGGVRLSGDAVTFTFDRAGTYPVSVFVSDSNGDEDEESKNVTVTAPVSENRAPIARDDQVTTTAGTPLVISVLSNDSDPDNDSISITGTNGAENGSLQIEGSGIRYTANADYEGRDDFDYTISDGELTATASVIVNVQAEPEPDNQRPEGTTDAYEVFAGNVIELNVLDNDSDPDNDPIFLDSFTQPQSGTLTRINGNRLRYVAENAVGMVDFSYVISDSDLKSSPIGVTVTINQPPANSQQPNASITAPDYVDAGTANVTLDGSASADPDGSIVSYSWTQQAGGPVLQLRGADTAVVSFDAPLVEEPVIVNLILTVTDNDGLSASATTTIQIGFVDSPIVVIDTPDQFVLEGDTVTLSGRGFFKGEELTDLFWAPLGSEAASVPTSDLNQPAITFVAPAVAEDEELVLQFQLTLNTDLAVMPTDTVTVTVTDNGVTVAGAGDGFITTKAANAEAVPFGVKVSQGQLIMLEPQLMIETAGDRTNRPRTTPIDMVKTQLLTETGGTAVITFKLVDPLPDDYTWFLFRDEVNAEGQQLVQQWVPFGELTTGDTWSINEERTEVTLRLQDYQTAQPKMADGNAEAGVITLISGPGQISNWTEGTATVGGAVGGLSLVMMLLARIFHRAAGQHRKKSVNQMRAAYSLIVRVLHCVARHSQSVIATAMTAIEKHSIQRNFALKILNPREKCGLVAWMRAMEATVWRIFFPGILLFVASSASAVDLEYYAGGSLGSVTQEKKAAEVEKNLEVGGGPEVDISLNGSNSIFKAYAGAFFSKNLGMRIAYVNLGDAKINIGAGLAADEETAFADDVFAALPNTGSGFAFSLQGRFPISDQLTLHDWGGLFFWQNDVSLNLNGQTINSSRSGTDLLLGAALEYQLGENAGLRLELERYNQDGGGITMLGLGAAYYF